MDEVGVVALGHSVFVPLKQECICITVVMANYSVDMGLKYIIYILNVI